MYRRHIILAFIAIIAPPGFGWQAEELDYDDFFYAIAEVESGHDDTAVGDGGKSIGRFQIQFAYWKDAHDHNPFIGGKYRDVVDPVYARKVMTAYFSRYAPQAWADKDWETLARTHVGGPKGPQRKSSLPYWRKVNAQLEKGK